MQKKRLLKLADFLETVPEQKFSLATWVQSMPTKPEARAEGSCGFAGCAIGWAVHAKLFRGLSFVEEEDQKYVNRGPSYKGLSDFPAVNHLFDISTNDSFSLFIDTAYPGWSATPKQVADRIRKFVETGSI